MATNVFSMPSSSALLLFSFAFVLTSARPWHEATKTSIYRADNWSPRPTQMSVNPRDLFTRDHIDVAVCGWIGGDSASPVACASGSSCVHDTVHAYVGCCATSGPCTAGVYTSCVDQNSESWGEDSGLVDTGVYTCSSGSYCYKNTYPGGYSQYNCGLADQATTVETSFTGKPSDLLLQVVYTGVFFSPSSAPSSSTSSTSSPSSSTSQASTSQKSSQTPASSSLSSSSDISSTSSQTTKSTLNPAAGVAATTTAASRSSKNTKAIIGGIVGGFAVLTAVLGILLFFFQRRHALRNQQRAGPFISNFKNGQPRTNGLFQRIAPHSPSDFQSTMTEHNLATPSAILAPFPNTRLSPTSPAAQSISSPRSPGDENSYQDLDSTSAGSEIDDFARGFNEVARYHQPAHHSVSPDSYSPPPDFEIPIFAPQHQLASADPSALAMLPSVASSAVSATGGGLRRGGSANSARDKQRERERLMGENKDDDDSSGSGNLMMGSGSNVREEGWVPQRLRPSPPRSRENEKKYQLVDEAPRDGVRVLRLPDS